MWSLVVPSVATKGFQIGTFILPFWAPFAPLPAVTVYYDVGLPESPRNSSKEGQMMSLVFHEFDLGWAGFVLRVMLSLGRERKSCLNLLRNCHCESGDVNPKSWINHTLPAAFPWSLKHTHLLLFCKLLPRIAVVQNLALGGTNLVCSVCISTHSKQFRMKGVGTTRYHQHFVSRMSLLDWNWWTCAKRCGESGLREMQAVLASYINPHFPLIFICELWFCCTETGIILSNPIYLGLPLNVVSV